MRWSMRRLPPPRRRPNSACVEPDSRPAKGERRQSGRPRTWPSGRPGVAPPGGVRSVARLGREPAIRQPRHPAIHGSWRAALMRSSGRRRSGFAAGPKHMIWWSLSGPPSDPPCRRDGGMRARGRRGSIASRERSGSAPASPSARAFGRSAIRAWVLSVTLGRQIIGFGAQDHPVWKGQRLFFRGTCGC
jgi:hypothetical protein